MKILFVLFIIPLFSLFFNTEKAHSAALLESETRVLFQLPEEYVITRMANEDSRITKSYEIRDPGTLAQDRFVLQISAEPLEKLLERLRFQSLASEQLKNRDIKGKTTIEAIGKDHETGELGKLILFSHAGKSISVQYFGTDSEHFEAFISGISFPLAPFSDTLNHVFEKEIASLAEAKIMKGYLTENLLSYEFKPEKPITRAEFLKIVTLSISGLREEHVRILNTRSLHSPRPACPEPCRRVEMTEMVGMTEEAFFDVQPDDWFFPYVQFGVELGWIKGYANKTFRPHATITVAEALKLLITSRDIFVEPPASGQQWYQSHVDVMINNKILSNEMRDLSARPPKYSVSSVEMTDKINMTPGSALTRSQAAALIIRLENAMETEESSW